MSDLRIPDDLVELQRRTDAAFDAMEAQRQELGRATSQWPEAERQRSTELLQAATEAAQALRDAITASGLEKEHGSARFQPALKQAAREK